MYLPQAEGRREVKVKAHVPVYCSRKTEFSNQSSEMCCHSSSGYADEVEGSDLTSKPKASARESVWSEQDIHHRVMLGCG